MSDPLDFSRLGPLPGTRCVVVGGCGGIGRPIVKALVESGVKTAVIDLEGSLAKHPPPADVLTLPTDATSLDSVSASFEKLHQAWGGLDCMINLCGFAMDNLRIGDLPEEQWDEVVAGNMKAAFLVSKFAAPIIEQSGGGTIVHMSSGLGSYGGKGYGTYSASKAAVMAMTKSLAHEYGPKVRVNAVAPGAVNTDFLMGGLGRMENGVMKSRFDREDYLKRIPLGFMAEPEDMTGPILFLAGPASRYVNGQTLHINGGALMP